MYLSLWPLLLPLGIWYRTVWSYSVQAIIIGCVLCRCAFKMHLFTHGWCLYTFFFRDKGDSPVGGPCNLQPRLSRFGLSNINVQGLYSPTRYILLYFSSAQWPKIWIKSTTCRRCVWQSALHHRGKQCPGESSIIPTLIQLHLLQGRRPMMRKMFLWYFRCIWGRTTIHEIIEDQGSVSGTALKLNFSSGTEWTHACKLRLLIHLLHFKH